MALIQFAEQINDTDSFIGIFTKLCLVGCKKITTNQNQMIIHHFSKEKMYIN